MTEKNKISFNTASNIKKSTSTAITYITITDCNDKILNDKILNDKTTDNIPIIQDYFDIPLLSRFINIVDKNHESVESKNGAICGVSSSNDYSSGTGKVVKFLKKTRRKKPLSSEERRKQTGKYKFDNQVSVIFKYWGFRSVNVKIFNNGKLQMTGIQYDGETKLIAENMVSILKDTFVKVYTSISQLPTISLDDNNCHYAIVYNSQTDKSTYYRWNFFKQFKNIKYLDKYDKIDKLIPEWNTDAEIKQFLPYIEDIKKRLTIELSSVVDKYQQTSDTMEKSMLEDDINLLEDKICHYRGLIKYISDVRDTDIKISENIILNNKKAIKVAAKDGDIFQINTVDKKYKYSVHKDEVEKIGMINSDFNVGFPINNNKLYKLINKNKIKSSYEPSDYPGVIVYYYWNKNHSKLKINDTNLGRCSCEEHCAIKGKKNGCIKITLFVFQSGHVVITGSRNTTQIKDCFKFIRNYLINNKEHFIGEYSEEDIKKITKKTNEIRKLMKKTRLFYAVKSNIVFPKELEEYTKHLLTNDIVEPC